jgi:hypothetical protein
MRVPLPLGVVKQAAQTGQVLEHPPSFTSPGGNLLQPAVPLESRTRILRFHVAPA